MYLNAPYSSTSNTYLKAQLNMAYRNIVHLQNIKFVRLNARKTFKEIWTKVHLTFYFVSYMTYNATMERIDKHEISRIL